MFYIIYSSKAAPGIQESDLKDIISTAEKRNNENHITGILIYHDGTFIQMLEGDEDAVNETFDRIQEDARHTTVLKLFSGNEEERHFPKWKMALKVVDESTFKKINAYESLEEGSRFLNQINDGHIGLRMLRFFYEMKK